MEHAVLAIVPDAQLTIFGVVFNDAGFLARGHLAVIEVEQAVCEHHDKPALDHAAITVVESGVDVVPASPTRQQAEVGGEGHLVSIGGKCKQPKCGPSAQLHVGNASK